MKESTTVFKYTYFLIEYEKVLQVGEWEVRWERGKASGRVGALGG